MDYSVNEMINKIDAFDITNLKNIVNYNALINNRVIPFFEERDSVFVFSDSNEYKIIMDIEFATKKNCKVHLVKKEDLDFLIEYINNNEFKSTIKNENKGLLFETSDVEKDNIKIVNYLNRLIEYCIRNEISDLHIEPQKDYLRIRIRKDGKLIVKDKLDIDSYQVIITRIKVIAKLDLAERRLPQDGRITFEYENRFIDLRISIVPTINGEKVVIRFLDSNFKYNTLESLGLSEEEIRIIDKYSLKQNGMILVVGPTGSGKTTTIYSILNKINTEDINITTLEDPVEVRLDGINQIQINTKQGLFFNNTLRNILRQDPEVLLIGELLI